MHDRIFCNKCSKELDIVRRELTRHGEYLLSENDESTKSYVNPCSSCVKLPSVRCKGSNWLDSISGSGNVRPVY